MPRFRYVDHGAEKTVELTGDLVVVGSDAACQIVLTDPHVSPVHCEFRRGGNGWRVVDLESREGTSVNGEFVNQRVLSEGDTVQLGGVRGVVTGVSAAGDLPQAQPRSPLAQPHSPLAQPLPPLAQPLPPLAQPVPPLAQPLPPLAQPLAAAHRPPLAKRAGAAAPAPARRDHTAGMASSEQARPQRSAQNARNDDQDDESARKPSRRKSQGSPMLVVGSCISVLVLLIFVVARRTPTTNEVVAEKMVQAENKADWTEMARLAAQADPTDAAGYQRVAGIRARADLGLKGVEAGKQNEQSLREWNELLGWWQHSEPKDPVAYEKRLDDYLSRWSEVGSTGPTQARQERVKHFGSASPGGVIPAGEGGYFPLKTDVELLANTGRFGEAVQKLDRWWAANSTTASARTQDIEKLRAMVIDAGGKWVSSRILVAMMAKDRGEPTKARKILIDAAEKVGIPELAARAQEALTKL